MTILYISQENIPSRQLLIGRISFLTIGTHLEELPVWFSTREMVLLTLSLFMKVSLYPMLSSASISPEGMSLLAFA
jgi:hypothetical protein